MGFHGIFVLIGAVATIASGVTGADEAADDPDIGGFKFELLLTQLELMESRLSEHIEEKFNALEFSINRRMNALERNIKRKMAIGHQNKAVDRKDLFGRIQEEPKNQSSPTLKYVATSSALMATSSALSSAPPCSVLYASDNSGMCTMKLKNTNHPAFEVHAQRENRGMWITVQERTSDVLDFQRSWAEYRDGFGEVGVNYWLGLENIYQIVRDGSVEMHMVFYTQSGNRHYHRQLNFSIGGETERYALKFKPDNDFNQPLFYESAPFQTVDWEAPSETLSWWEMPNGGNKHPNGPWNDQGIPVWNYNFIGTTIEILLDARYFELPKTKQANI